MSSGSQSGEEEGTRGRAQAQAILTRLAVSAAVVALDYGTVADHAEVWQDWKPLGTDETGGRRLPPFESMVRYRYCGNTVVGSEVVLSSTEP